ncbi:hypothetical protein QE392_003383 [Microbacterium proteolyticum]|nr:hypothetical protein [Microbacterium proteolyticum]
MPAHEIDPRALQPLDLTGVVVVAGHGVASAQDGGDIELAGDGLFRAVDVARGAQRGTAAQEGLGGHACPVRALAADELGLDDYRGEPGLDGTVGDVLAHGTGADDDEVVFAFAHAATVPAASDIPRGLRRVRPVSAPAPRRAPPVRAPAPRRTPPVRALRRKGARIGPSRGKDVWAVDPVAPPLDISWMPLTRSSEPV